MRRAGCAIGLVGAAMYAAGARITFAPNVLMERDGPNRGVINMYDMSKKCFRNDII